jgi:hypothetical protein
MYCSIEILQDWSTFVDELDCVLDIGVFPEPNSDLCFALRVDLFQPTASPKFFTISHIFDVGWYLTCLHAIYVFLNLSGSHGMHVVVVWHPASGDCGYPHTNFIEVVNQSKHLRIEEE